MNPPFLPPRFIFGVLQFFVTLCLTFAMTGVVVAQDSTDQANDSTGNQESLEEYAGSYGPRKILFRDGGLMYQRDGMPTPVTLKALGDDRFEVVVPPGAQVRGPAADGPIPIFVFGRNEAGVVANLSLVNPDGTVLAASDKDG